MLLDDVLDIGHRRVLEKCQSAQIQTARDGSGAKSLTSGGSRQKTGHRSECQGETCLSHRVLRPAASPDGYMRVKKSYRPFGWKTDRTFAPIYALLHKHRRHDGQYYSTC